MSIWNKILVGLLIAIAPVLFYTSARMLKTYAVWQKAAAQLEKRLAETEAEVAKTTAEVEQLHVKMHIALADRQRVWYRCEPEPLNRKGADGKPEVTVSIDSMMNAGIDKGTVLHVFETPNEAGICRYLGEFTTTSVVDKKVKLVPTGSALTNAEIDQLDKAKRPWNLYEALPHDSHEVFAGVAENQLRDLVPAETLADYVKDGKKAGDDAPKTRVDAEGKYKRPLRDYAFLLSMLEKKKSDIREAIDLVKRDNEYLFKCDDEKAAISRDTVKSGALVDAWTEADTLKKDIARANEELKEGEHERDAVAAVLSSYQKATADAQAAIEKLVKNNQVMAGRIAKHQLDAVERIDERTRAVTQTGTGI